MILLFVSEDEKVPGSPSRRGRTRLEGVFRRALFYFDGC